MEIVSKEQIKKGEILVKSLELHYPGDSSVGVFPESFKIEGDLVFEDAKSLSEFKRKLADIFEEHLTGERAAIYATKYECKKEPRFCTGCGTFEGDLPEGSICCPESNFKDAKTVVKAFFEEIVDLKRKRFNFMG